MAVLVYTRAPTLAEVAGGLTLWTAANDIALNSPATRTLSTVGCPDEVEVSIAAVVMRMLVGNLKQRFLPELVGVVLEHPGRGAREAGRADPGGTAGTCSVPLTTAGTILGTARDVSRCVTVCAQVRAWHRTDDDPPAQLTMLAPSWLQNAMRVDFLRQQPGDEIHRGV